jgi:urocanate hydratase
MPRTIRAPRGVQLTCKNWLIEAAYRMLQNDLGEVDSQSTPLQFVRERAMIVRQI